MEGHFLIQVALKVMILELPLSSDAVNGIPAPMQNPVRGTLTVRDMRGEAQHRQQMVFSSSSQQSWYVDVNSVDDLDICWDFFIDVEMTRRYSSFDFVANIAVYSSCKGTWKPFRNDEPKRQNVLSWVEDPLRDLFVVPQHDDLIDVVFARAIISVVYSPLNQCKSFERDGDSFVRFAFVRHDHNISGYFSRSCIDRLTRRVV